MKKLLLLLLCVHLIFSCGEDIPKEVSCESQIESLVYEKLDWEESVFGRPPLDREKITIRHIECSCYENPYYGERDIETKYRISCTSKLRVDKGYGFKYQWLYYNFNANCDLIKGWSQDKDPHIIVAKLPEHIIDGEDWFNEIVRQTIDNDE